MEDEGGEQVFVSNMLQRRLLIGLASSGLLLGLLLAIAGGDAVLWGILLACGAALLDWRLLRFGLEASSTGVTIRNLGRTYVFRWAEVTDLRVDTNSNATSMASCLMVDNTRRNCVQAMGTSSYSRRKVEAMLVEVRRLRTPV